MNGVKQHQSVKEDDVQTRRTAPRDVLTAALAPFGSDLGQMSRLPAGSQTRPLRQAAMLQMQQQHGNGHVQRLLNRQQASHPNALMRTADEGVCPVCGRRGRGRCSGCGQSFQSPGDKSPGDKSPGEQTVQAMAVMPAMTLSGPQVMGRMQAPELWLQRAPTTLPPRTSGFWSVWRAQLAMARRMFQEQRYGCWCGPGNVCHTVTDKIDSCCKAHDLAYAAANVTSDDPAPAGSYNMWTIEGLKRSMAADLALVSCTQATKFDLHFYGPTAAVYREGVALIFGIRSAAAAAAITAGL